MLKHPLLLLTAAGAALAIGAAVLIAVQLGDSQIEFEDFEKAWLRRYRHSIRYAPLPEAPPFDYIDKDGNHLGITSDYVRLIEKKLGTSFKIVSCASMQEVKLAWESGHVDLIGSLQDRPERREYLRFSEPYYSVGNVILMRKGAELKAFSIEDLKHFSVAIVEGSATHDYFSEQYPDYNIVGVTTVSNGFVQLSARRVDALITDKGVAYHFIEQRGYPDIEVTGLIEAYSWDLCFATSRKHTELKPIIDKVLRSITPLERFNIHRKWMAKTEMENLLRAVAITCLIITLVVFGLFMLRNRILKRQVRHRTIQLGRIRHSHQEATRALDESEQRFRTLVESSNDIIWEIDRNGNYTYISPRVKDIFGYEPHQVIGRSAQSFMIPADTAKALQGLREATAETVIDCEVTTHLHRKGHKVILETSGMAFTDNTGQWAGFRGVSRDITERVEAEAALKESEGRFRNLVETTSDWIWEADAEGHFTYASPQTTALLGYAPDELIGKSITDTMPRDEAIAMAALFRELADHGVPMHSLVNINRHRDGRIVVFETSAVPFYDDEWNIQGYRGIGRDITDRMDAEKRLEFERNLFRSFMNHVPYLIYFKDADGRFIEVNEAKAREVNLSPEEVAGKTDFDFFPAEQAQQRFDDEMEVMRTEHPIQKEELWTAPEGDRWYLTTKIPSYDEEGKVVGTIGTSWDITYRKQASEELRRLRAQLSNIIDSMPSILVGVDIEGRITQWNREAESEVQIQASEAVGKPLKEVFPGLSKEMVKVERAIRERTAQKEERIQEQVNGHIRYTDITVYPLLENNAEGAVIRIDDVTDRVRIEEMMVQSEKMMSVGGLAAGMAHEINNPLAGILQNLQVMKNRITLNSDLNLDAAAAAGTTLEAIQAYMQERGLVKMMDSVTEAGRRAAKIVDNMLSFSRKEESYFTPNNLSEILERTIELASNDYDLKKRFDFRHIKIEREYDAAIEDIPCEAGQIQQVILNLLTNSAQAMSEQEENAAPPKITLRLKREPDMALVEVEDNGPGMDDETRKRVFEPFFTTKEVGRGTGLGLSVSFFIITENHGGTMRVRSTPGNGTCFSIRIPYEHRQVRWGLRL